MLANIDRHGKAIPIVLVHGSGFSKEVFERQFAGRTLAGRRLIAIDLPGHGESADATDPQAVYSFSGFADAILEFVSAKKLDPCIVAGWSLGGHAALDLIGRSDRIAGVMAFGAPPAANGPLGLIRSMHFCRLLLLAGKGRLSQAETEYFERTCLNGQRPGQFIETLQRVDPLMRPNVSRAIFARRTASQKELVETAEIPVCLLQGGDDALVRTNFMRNVSGPTLFGGETIVFEDCGHAPFLEQPEKFDRLLDEFATAVETGAAHRRVPDLAKAS